MLSLVEKAQQEFDQDEMLRQEERLKKGEFTLDDFRKQLSQIGKLGPLQKVMGMIPGMGGMTEMMGDVDHETGHEAAVRHHRLDDAGRTPQALPRRSIKAAGAASRPVPASSRTKSATWSSSSTRWRR